MLSFCIHRFLYARCIYVSAVCWYHPQHLPAYLFALPFVVAGDVHKLLFFLSGLFTCRLYSLWQTAAECQGRMFWPAGSFCNCMCGGLMCVAD
jgi:hypothetical protein